MSDSTPPRLSLDDWLSKISRQLDILTLVLLDVRRDLNGQQTMMELPDPDQLPATQQPAKPPTPLGEPQIMADGDRTFIRQPLPGKNFLMATMNSKTGVITSLQLETPNGDRADVDAAEVEATFGIKLPQVTKDVTPSHPTDRSLNPDVEIADGR